MRTRSPQPDVLLFGGDGAGKAVEYLLGVTAWLHRDDAQLVLLIHPHKEGLLVVVKDTTPLGPVAYEQVQGVEREELTGWPLGLLKLLLTTTCTMSLVRVNRWRGFYSVI